MNGLETAARILVAVVAAAGPDARAAIWRRPEVEVRGPADFPPRAGLELALHGHDVCAGLGVPLVPPPEVIGRLCRHTAGWPMWGMLGWSSPGTSGDPWAALLTAAGRVPRTTAEEA